MLIEPSEFAHGEIVKSCDLRNIENAMSRNKSFDVLTLIDDVISSHSNLIDNNSVEIFVSKIDVPCLVVTRPIKLFNVLSTLLSLSLTSIDSGKIEIKVRGPQKGIRTPWLDFSIISSSGKIISAKSSVFLAVQNMGGVLSVESVEGRGSSLTFSIPACILDNRLPDRSFPSKSFKGKTALVAEDDEISRIIFKEIFESVGISVCLVSDGQEAVDQLEGSLFDIIFVDIKMPKLGGLELLSLLREKEEGKGYRTPVVIMTSNVKLLRAPGSSVCDFDHLLKKPCSPIEVEDVLASLLSYSEVDVANRKELPALDENSFLNLEMLHALGKSRQEVLNNVVTTWSVNKSKMVLAINNHDFAMVESMSHKFKSGCMLICDRRIYDTFHKIEDGAKKNDIFIILDYYFAISPYISKIILESMKLMENSSADI